MPGLFAARTPSKTQSFRDFLIEPPENAPSSELNPSPPPTAKRTTMRTPDKLAVDDNDTSLDNPDMGPFLLKMARDTVHSGQDPKKALEYAIRASEDFERVSGPSPDLATCLHVVAAILSGLGRLEEAVETLKRSILVSDSAENGSGHAMMKFSGLMQLGDTYSMIGQLDRSIECYESGLKIQVEALGRSDPRVAETCRYLAEAHVQAMQFDEAEKFCKKTLEIHREHCSPASLTEAADRRLMALICEAKGEYEPALEHLVLASMSMIAHGQDNEVAAIDVSIGDIYLSLCRFDEAIFAYQKALTVFKTTKGESHSSIALVYIRLADLYYKTGKLRESKSYCENALRIYSKPVPGTTPGEIASGLNEISAIYEALNEPEEALKLLQKAVKLLETIPGQYRTVAGIESQIGVIFYMVGRYSDAWKSFASAIAKLRASGERKSAFFGFVLNQMGLACVQLYKIAEAATHFEEAREILEQECGTYHLDTLGVYSNLAATYDAMGRVEDAIEILEYILKMREEKLGTANPDADDERKRLFELLKEAGRVRNKKAKSLENLIESKSFKMKNEGKKKRVAFGLRT